MYLAQMHLLPCWQRRAQVARVLPEQLTGRYFWPFQAGCRLPKHGRSPFLASRTKSDCSRLSREGGLRAKLQNISWHQIF